MRKHKIKPDISIYNVPPSSSSSLQVTTDAMCCVRWQVFIEGAMRETGYSKALQVFELMKAEGVRPSHTTFSILIDAAGHAGRPEEAEAHFAAMGTSPRPDTNNYNSLIEALARNGQLDKAERVLDSLLRHTHTTDNRGSTDDHVGLARPTAKSFSSLLGFCLERKDVVRARRLAEKMRRASVAPDAIAQRQLDQIPAEQHHHHHQHQPQRQPNTADINSKRPSPRPQHTFPPRRYTNPKNEIKKQN
jgi:pentatricopeptide repeat protein